MYAGACQECGLTNQEHTRRYGVGLHLHRQDRSGPYIQENVTTLCIPCHSQKTRRYRKRDHTRTQTVSAWVGVERAAAVAAVALKLDCTRQEVVRIAIAALLHAHAAADQTGDGNMTGAEIRALRLSLGMTQADLAKYLGLDTLSAVSHLEASRRLPTGPVLRLLEILRDSGGKFFPGKPSTGVDGSQQSR